MSDSSPQSKTARTFPWKSVTVLTVVFTASYFGLRALPDAQCGFLHYEEVVMADGTIEFCATNHAGFIDLTRLDYPVRTQLTFQQPPVVGELAEVTMELTTEGGMPIAPHELAQTHTKQMHLMVIDASLEDYHHIHPQAEGMDGRYTFSFTPGKAGNYRFFTEVVPVVTRRQLIATSEEAVEGLADPLAFEASTRESVVDGIRFTIEGLPERLKTNTDYRLSLNVAAESGGPVSLQEIMGARGHMVAFDAERRGFAHMHPIDSVASYRTAGLGASTESGDLGFILNVPNPGWYRVFAQIQVEGREVFGRFDVRVE